MLTVRTFRYALAAGLLLLGSSSATLIPSVSFEQLTDTSEMIVAGRITNSWPAWDAEHKYIWTHYNLTVSSAVKGSPGAVVEFAEPGGALDGRSTMIAGTVTYAVGDNLVLFLARMPNGYLRTTGWAQGKYALDANGRLHANASLGAEAIQANSPSGASSVRTLDGMSITELRQRVAARLSAGVNQGKVQ
jgi:hypothetical protein